MHGDRRTVGDGAFHRVLVDDPAGVVGIAEELERRPVLVGDRRAGQPEELRLRQGRAHVGAEPAVLGTVCLVDEDDDVVPVVELAGAFEPEDRGDDDPPLVVGEHVAELVLGAGDSHAWEPGGAELGVGLLDEVNPVQDDHDGRSADVVVVKEADRGEGHEERFAGALVVPDEALRLVRVEDARVDRLDRFDLRVPGDELDEDGPAVAARALEQGVVPKDRKHRGRVEEQLDGALHPGPTVEGVRVGGGTPEQPRLGGLVDGAVVELPAFGGEGRDVGDEELGDLVLVDVVDVPGGVQPGNGRLHRCLRLADDEREPVDPEDDVEAAFVARAAVGDLVGHDESVVGQVVEVDELDRDVLVSADEAQGLIASEPGGEPFVGGDEAVVRC